MMKLYVWNNPISISWGGTCLYVVAETEEQARVVASRALISRFGDEPEGVPGKDAPAFNEPLGLPDRVINAPYGEIYYWSE